MVLTKTAEFQSTHPARGATTRTSTAQANVRFQSTHPARGATAHKRDHARRILYFNPRTPRGVRLTLPTARAPQNTISIHAPREGCDQDIHPLLRDMYISIHAPREGCDEVQPWMFGHPVQFQSTHPARGATVECLNNLINHPISIHAPREGCDRKAFKSISKAKHFNPRPPRGVRQGPSGRCSRDSDNFNPRTPRGVRPRPPPSLCHSQSISIHAPREGCDWRSQRLLLL